LTVIIVECAKPGLRGQLTRWMLEVRAGVFVGTLSARVRAKLWALVCRRIYQGGSLLIYRSPNEQGFIVETFGDTSRSIIDMDGLQLVQRPLEAPREASALRPKG
jgi:CRISPR-associated protein Cas2